MPAAAFRRASDLPQVIPVFPLDGALLLPGGDLPLQIFEPRYLNMIDDVMAGDRMIGMVQTRSGGDRTRPNLASVGCCGRITSFSETSDGRYLITLTGVCRFLVREELSVATPYRQVRAEFESYAEDLSVEAADIPAFDRRRFAGAPLRRRHINRAGACFMRRPLPPAPRGRLGTPKRLRSGLAASRPMADQAQGMFAIKLTEYACASVSC